MNAQVTIVIVSHFSAEDLKRCIPSIHDASRTPTPTIVIDNATTDNSVSTVMQQFPSVKLISSTENLGYGRAVNRAVREEHISTEWILVTNPDTEFHSNAIDALLAAVESFPGVGSAGPRIWGDDGTVYPSARALPSLRNGIGHALFKKIWPRNPWSRAYLQTQITIKIFSDESNPEPSEPRAHSASQPIPTGWLSGACLLIRTEAFQKIGGFDPRFFMYFEDMDLGERLGKAGYINIYVPSATVTHIGAQSTKRYSKRMRTIHHHSASIYLTKRYSQWYQWPVRAVLGIALAVRSFLGR